MLCYSFSTQRVGPSKPVDLKTLTGLPGRLFFRGGPLGRRTYDLPCTFSRLTRAEILLEPECWEGPLPADGSSVILEVACRSAKVQCFTFVDTAGRERISLRLPASLHVVQRRLYPRIECYIGINLLTADPANEPLAAQLINLSVDGAACVVAEPLDPGSLVTLDLTPLGFSDPRVSAAVVRVAPSPNHLWVTGLQFRNLSPEQEGGLIRYVSEYMYQEDG